MKTLRSRTGPFRERPYFDPGEIDRICADELRKVGLLPGIPSPIRIDRFIEKRFGVCPEYDHLPEGVLGYTRFGTTGVEAIIVANALEEEGSEVSDRRIRTTMAHEAGHALLHAQLFARSGQSLPLFGGNSNPEPQVLCRDVPGHIQDVSAYRGHWWEFQANQAIGGLLVPRILVEEALRPFLTPTESEGPLSLELASREHAVRTLAELFQVNPAVTRIRINDLFPVDHGGQLSL